MLSHPFRKCQRLSRKKDFKTVFTRGISRRNDVFRISYVRKADGPSRIAVSVSKRSFKLAVARNRIRRWTREYFREHQSRLKGPCDLLINVSAGESAKRYDLFTAALEETFRRAELLES